MNLIARTPAQAVQAQLEPLQGAVSCLTEAILLQTGRVPATGLYGADLSVNPAPLRSAPPGLAIFVSLFFRSFPLPEQRSRWHAEVAGYRFTLNAADARELFAYHWHPHGPSPVTFPHLHVAQGVADYAGMLAAAHFPTGAVALPDVLRLLIADFGVRPRRRDWARVLDAASRADP